MSRSYITGLLLLILMAACATHKPKEEITLTGKVRSLRGVMNELSCYCYNAAYLSTADSQIRVCFPDEEEIACEEIEVTGYYENKTIDPEATSPCPSGQMRIFYVTSYTCI